MPPRSPCVVISYHLQTRSEITSGLWKDGGARLHDASTTTIAVASKCKKDVDSIRHSSGRKTVTLQSEIKGGSKSYKNRAPNRKGGQPIWTNVPQKYMQTGKHFGRMHINRAASRLSSDRVAMRLIVTRLTQASEKYYLPLRSVMKKNWTKRMGALQMHHAITTCCHSRGCFPPVMTRING